MKKITTIVITAALTSAVILSTNTLISQSKTKNPVKNNVYITNQKTLLSEVTNQNILKTPVVDKELIAKDTVDALAIKNKQDELVKQAEASQLATIALAKANQTESSKLAQIAANTAKQEEIDRIAIVRPANSTQQKIVANYRTSKLAPANANQEDVNAENVQIVNQATVDTTTLTQEEDAAAEAERLAKIEADRLAQIEADRLAKIEADKRVLLLRNQTTTTTRLSTYLSPSANVSSVLNRAVALHSGDPSNTCIYFSSEAMRRIGVSVPTATCNTGQYLSYLRSHAWISSSAIKELIPGNICFTTNGWNGYPTHTFVFMGWVTEGNYTWAYVADNQGNSVHIRNMGATYATDAFAFYMHTPTAPQGIAALSSGYNSIYVGWNAVAGVNGYEIYRATSSAGSYTLISRTTGTRFSNTGLTTNKAYYYKVKSYKIVGSAKQYSGFSTAISSKPIPSSPTSVKVASSSYNSIKTSWNVATGANGYEVYRATSSDGSYTLVSKTTAQSYIDSELTTDSTYYYKIRAYRMVGSIKMCSVFTTPINSKPVLSTPTVTAISSSSSSITTSWDDVTGADGYEVYSAPSSQDPYTFLTETTENKYNNTELTINNNYYYMVRAFTMIDDLKVYSNWSSAISSKPVLMPSPPSNVKAIRTTSSSIRLSWSPEADVNGYEIFKATSSNESYSLLYRMSSSYPYYTNSRLVAGTTYYYKVRSFLTVGDTKVYSNWSTEIHAQP